MIIMLLDFILRYCRYNAVPDGKCCVKCRCKTYFFSNSRLDSPPSPRLWRASFARSVALRLFLLAQKKSTYGIPDGLPSVALAKDGGDGATFQQPFLSVIFYAQRIKKFAEAIPYFIESYRTAKKVL